MDRAETESAWRGRPIRRVVLGDPRLVRSLTVVAVVALAVVLVLRLRKSPLLTIAEDVGTAKGSLDPHRVWRTISSTEKSAIAIREDQFVSLWNSCVVPVVKDAKLESTESETVGDPPTQGTAVSVFRFPNGRSIGFGAYVYHSGEGPVYSVTQTLFTEWLIGREMAAGRDLPEDMARLSVAGAREAKSVFGPHGLAGVYSLKHRRLFTWDQLAENYQDRASHR